MMAPDHIKAGQAGRRRMEAIRLGYPKSFRNDGKGREEEASRIATYAANGVEDKRNMLMTLLGQFIKLAMPPWMMSGMM
jgi:hypothetical protein